MKKGYILLICLLLGGWLFLITSINLGVLRSGRQVSKLQNEVAIKEARNQYEEVEIARLSSPQAIIDFAQEKLGMVEEKPHEVILLEADQ